MRNVAKHFPTAIISGRCRDKVLNPYGISCVVDGCALPLIFII